MSLAKRDDSIETLLLNRADEPLGIGVEIGTLRRQPDRLDTAALQDLAKGTCVEGTVKLTLTGQAPPPMRR